ncbi:MAG: hypothetical protein LH471_01255 [Salinibacterium sp.]|nr:hypothetical protein [Salinibacterium sp.]
MATPSAWIISSPDSRIEVELDPISALPLRLTRPDEHGLSRSLAVAVLALIDGTEGRGWTGGLRYDDVITIDELVATGPAHRTHRGTSDDYAIPVRFGPMTGRLAYGLRPTAPYVELRLELDADTEVLLRNLRITIEVEGDPRSQRLHIPGGAVHRGVSVHELGDEPLGVSPLGGLRGSSAIIGIESDGATLTVWPTHEAEISDIVVHRRDNGVRIEVDTNLAAAIGPENSVAVPVFTLDLQAMGLDELRSQWPDWASRLGLTTPPVKPTWADGACIYEVQIGTSHFWGGHSYTRYAEIAELTRDLDRVQALGFTVIQLMPRQPYPSYNVHDYADISTSYGDERQLIELVQLAHERGVRVIIDVLLHGVVDNESVDMALAGIAEGPLAARLDEVTADSFRSDLSDPTNYSIAWSRHIRDFAEHWKGGSPARTPLQDAHPDWFSRDSAGNVTGVYTKAFDARNAEWQRYFRDAMINLVRTLDIDGFRFDAPTYNNFSNWSGWARARARLSPLGCGSLFVDLRRDIKNEKPDALMYTEPSGHLLRRSMDLNYNYDEQWLVTALMNPAEANPRGVTSARQLMQWMLDRDAFLPMGSRTAHHIDSHDTFWWPQWGAKWRREQFGIEAVRALTVTFMALDGPYMMFTGGEQGIEHELKMMGSLRSEAAGFWSTPATFDTEADPTGDLLIVQRGGIGGELTIIVNLSRVEARQVPVTIGDRGASLTASGLADGMLAPSGYIVIRSDS